MVGALARHDAILREAVEAHGGRVVKTTGDGVHAAFANASDAVDAAIAAQLALHAEPWPEADSVAGADGCPHGRGRPTRRRLLRAGS